MSLASPRGSFEINESYFDSVITVEREDVWSEIDMELDRLMTHSNSTEACINSDGDDAFDMCWEAPLCTLTSTIRIEDVTDVSPGTAVVSAAADSTGCDGVLGELKKHADSDAIRRMRTPMPIAAVGHFSKQLDKQKKPTKPRKPSTTPKKRNNKPKKDTVTPPKTTTTSSTRVPKAVLPSDAKTLHHFQSRRFQAATRWANNMGFSAEQRQECRQTAYKEATIEWKKFYIL